MRCVSWMRFPQVSSKRAMMTLPTSIGSMVKVTPLSLRTSTVCSMSSTVNVVTGMPDHAIQLG